MMYQQYSFENSAPRTRRGKLGTNVETKNQPVSSRHGRVPKKQMEACPCAWSCAVFTVPCVWAHWQRVAPNAQEIC